MKYWSQFGRRRSGFVRLRAVREECSVEREVVELRRRSWARCSNGARPECGV
jgi:hypothetical protein